MAANIEEFSTITAKSQTTIPKAVRQALGVDYGDKLVERFAIDLDAAIDGHLTTLHPADHAVLIAALASPPQPTKKLHDAFAHHGQKIQSK